MANSIVIRMTGENAQLRESLNSSKREIAKLEKAVDRAKKNSHGSFDGLKKSALGSIGPLAGVGAAFGGIGAAGAFLKDSVNATEQLATSTKKLSRETGMDLQNSSAWVSLAKERGIDSNKLSLSFGNMSKQMHAAAGGSKTAAAALASVGVSSSLIKKGDLNGSLNKVADSFQKMKDGPNKTALALQLFGRQGKTLLPILNQGSKGVGKLKDEMEKAHLTMSGKTVASTMKLKAAQRGLHTQMDGLKVTLGTALIPALASAASGLTNFVSQAMQGKGAGGIFKDAVVNIFNAVKGLVMALLPAAKAIGSFLANNPGLVKFALILGTTGLAIFKAVKVVKTMIATFKTFAMFMRLLPMSMGPIGIALMVFALIAVLIITHWKLVKHWLGVVWGWIKSAFHAVANFVLSAAKRGFLGPIPLIISHWKEIWNFLKGLFNTIVGFLGGIVGKIAHNAERIGTALWDGIKSGGGAIVGVIKGVLNGVIGGMETGINTIINGLNHAIDLFNQVPLHDDIGHIGRVSLPRLASGGIVSGGRIAMIGEDGPEAVIPLSPKYRAQGASLYAKAGAAMGMGGHTFVVNNYGSQLNEDTLAARWAWQLQTRTT